MLSKSLDCPLKLANLCTQFYYLYHIEYQSYNLVNLRIFIIFTYVFKEYFRVSVATSAYPSV